MQAVVWLSDEYASREKVVKQKVSQKTFSVRLCLISAGLKHDWSTAKVSSLVSVIGDDKKLFMAHVLLGTTEHVIKDRGGCS